MLYRKILSIAVLGLLTSGIFVFLFSNCAVSGPDSVQYDNLGFNLASDRGFSIDIKQPYLPTMFREPAYPAFLALVYKTFGHSVNAVLFVQMMMHAFTAVIVYFIARYVFDDRVSILSAITVAVFPTLANMSACLLSETFFTFLLCLGLWSFFRALKSESIMWFVISGVVFGISTLTKASALFLPLALSAAAFIMAVSKKIDLKKTVLCLVIFIISSSLLVSGWAIRNKRIFNTSSLTLRAGEALWSRAEKLDDSKETIMATAAYSVSEYLGNKLFPGSTVRPERLLFKDFDRAEVLRKEYAAGGLSDSEIDKLFRDEAVGKILKRPVKYALYTFVEAIKMTAFTYLPVLNEPAVCGYIKSMNGGALLLSGMRGAARLAAYPILVLFFISIVRNLKIWQRWLPLLICVLYFNVIYSLLDAIGRYAVPLIPLYCIMAIAALFPVSRENIIKKG